jgi:23S rRNA pseudouridine1911/1915/1917 synthase
MSERSHQYERSFVVSDEEARERLDRFVELRLPAVSRGRIRAAIVAGSVTVDGEVRESGRRLRPGQVVEIRLAAPFVETMQPEAIPITVLYEDDGFLVVDKPAEMFAHPTHRVHSGTLLNAVAHHLNDGSPAREHVKPLLVHRLDRATSGLLVISKLPRVHTALSKAWSERRVEKRYVALVCGSLPDVAGVVDAPIGGSRDHSPGFRVMADGRPAQTRYRVVEERGPYALVELEPLTGRTNQLRIHMDHAGAPIAGDDLHGQPSIARFREVNPDAPYPARLFLHASRLAFEHPVTREPFVIDAPLPADLDAFLRALPHARARNRER